jgi:predicted double-glycine peptidase
MLNLVKYQYQFSVGSASIAFLLRELNFWV